MEKKVELREGDSQAQRTERYPSSARDSRSSDRAPRARSASRSSSSLLERSATKRRDGRFARRAASASRAASKRTRQKAGLFGSCSRFPVKAQRQRKMSHTTTATSWYARHSSAAGRPRLRVRVPGFRPEGADDAPAHGALLEAAVGSPFIGVRRRAPAGRELALLRLVAGDDVAVEVPVFC